MSTSRHRQHPNQQVKTRKSLSNWPKKGFMVIIVKELQSQTKFLQPLILIVLIYLVFNCPTKNSNSVMQYLNFFVFLRKAFFIQGNPINQEIFESFCCPLPKLSAANGVYAIANGDDGVEIVEFNCSFYFPFSFFLNYREKLGT